MKETVIFGKYEQDNDLSNGSENIEWLVLADRNDELLLLSKYALDSKPFHECYTDITWKYCTLRKWLNQDFIYRAFTEEEREQILPTLVHQDWQSHSIVNVDEDTLDDVFLLSYREAESYLDPTEYEAYPAPYTVVQGVWTEQGTGKCWWWLRPGYTVQNAPNMSVKGRIDYDGADFRCGGVRPAIWVNKCAITKVR